MSTENVSQSRGISEWQKGEVERERGVEVVVEKKRGEVDKGTGDVWPYCLAWK